MSDVGCTAKTGSRSLSTRMTSTRACTTDLLETTISLVSSSVMGDPANTSPKSTRVSETSICTYLPTADSFISKIGWGLMALTPLPTSHEALPTNTDACVGCRLQVISWASPTSSKP